MLIHNPTGLQKAEHIENEPDIPDWIIEGKSYTIKKGDKIGQITLLEHKGYLMGIESDVERDGGFGSTGE